MMNMRDAIKRLGPVYQHELSMSAFAESKGCDNIAGRYRERAEALQTAIAVLKMLSLYKAKADNVMGALRICRANPRDCGSCPYQDGTITVCADRMDDDIEELLVAAYAEGGDSDEQS